VLQDWWSGGVKNNMKSYLFQGNNIHCFTKETKVLLGSETKNL
jgi:hypothetical protein